ncbi:MAG TPA: response regulator [Rhizomicrobium sp.]|nr:response regulator [Rhizomicrobium sp.]
MESNRRSLTTLCLKTHPRAQRSAFKNRSAPLKKGELYSCFPPAPIPFISSGNFDATFMDSPRVLIADDEPELRQLFAEALGEFGIPVHTAASGGQALKILKENPGIEVLLSDIKMPGMDGYALASESLAMRPELKILLMTGFEQRTPPELLIAREIKTLHKPIKVSRLRELISGMLERP